MSLTVGTGVLAHDPRAPLARLHPLARLACAAIVMLALFVSFDLTTAAVALLAVVAFAWGSGLAPAGLARRVFPLLVAAAGIGLFNGLLAGDVWTGLTVAIRLLGIALAGVVALATIEPTALADALVQHLGVSHRFAIGALAGLRLLPLFAREWEVRGMARRARGIESERGLPARLGSFPARTHGLLVGAIRRATVLALAMDARGFGSRACRTLARPRSFASLDVALVALSAVLAAFAIALPVLLRRP